jgi:2-polyprenyl-3-methyl-5-hydroxy-6-metoxy-1,4-benzoquinol methylase
MNHGSGSPGAERLEHYHGQVRSDVLPSIPSSASGTLVDIGGGTGATALAAKRQGLADRAGVVDLIPFDPAGTGLDFHVSGDLERSDALDRAIAAEGSFDTILALDVLEHLVDPWAMVARLDAALKPGGVLIGSIPNIRHFSVSMPLLLAGKWQLEDDGLLDRTHLRFFVRETAIELMTCSGLVLENVDARVGGTRPIRIARRLSLGLLDRLTDFRYVIRVRKPA